MTSHNKILDIPGALYSLSALLCLLVVVESAVADGNPLQAHWEFNEPLGPTHQVVF